MSVTPTYYQNQKLCDAIAKHGNTSRASLGRYVFSKIKVYEDLCIFGKAFIENRVCGHINYLARFGHGDDSNGHDIETHNLMRLHCYGIVTTGGQCNKKETITASHMVCKRTLLEEQRGYLSFFVPKKDGMAMSLLVSLMKDDRVFVISHDPEEEWTCNNLPFVIDKEKGYNVGFRGINLTRYTFVDDESVQLTTNIWVQEGEHDMTGELACEKYPHIQDFLYDCFYIDVTCRDYNADTNCSDIVMEHVVKLNISRMLAD